MIINPKPGRPDHKIKQNTTRCYLLGFGWVGLSPNPPKSPLPDKKQSTQATTKRQVPELV
jgi:hypothetical protein